MLYHPNGRVKETPDGVELAKELFDNIVKDPRLIKKDIDPKERNYVLIRVHRMLQSYLEGDGVKFKRE